MSNVVGQQELSNGVFGVPFVGAPNGTGRALPWDSNSVDGYRTQLETAVRAQWHAMSTAAAHNGPYELSRQNMAAEWKATAGLQSAQQ